MSDTLAPTDLKVIRIKAFTTLEQRYPDDPTIGLIKHIDLTLAALEKHAADMSASEDEQARTTPGNSCDGSLDDVSEEIVKAAVTVFRKELHEPVYGRELLHYLRSAKVPLPDDDKRATAAITAVFARRPKLFQRFPGRNAKATSRWHLRRAA
jgi:hypothetical protein